MMGKSDLVWDYRSPRRTVIATTVRPAGSSQWLESSPSTQIPRSLSIMEQRPSMDRHAWNRPSYLSLRVMKKAEEEFVKYGTTEAMTVRHKVRRPSRVLQIFSK